MSQSPCKLTEPMELGNPCGAGHQPNGSGEMPSPCRRSERVVKKPSLFMVTHQKRRDKDLVAAIKRSIIETRQMRIDYTQLPEVPTVHLSPSDFSDPVKVWNKYTELGERFGAVKIVPPPGFKMRLAVDLAKFNFRVRQQRLDLLLSGKGFTHPQGLWKASEIQQADSCMLADYFTGVNNPTLKDIEREYWNLVKNGDKPITVHYGADLNIYSPEYKDARVQVDGDSRSDPWSITNIPRGQGSLLGYLHQIIPGVNSPWLYIGMCFSCFCWHTEDNYFGAVNYHHFGAPKIWYIVPARHASKMEGLLKNYIAMESAAFAVYSLRVQIPIDILLANDINVYRLVQSENEFVFAWPRTFHAGFNVGYNCNEACNIAPYNWVSMGYQSVLNYKFARKTCIPFYTIVMAALPHVEDLDPQGLDRILHVLVQLLITEHRNRKAITLPWIQMYIELEDIDKLDGVQRYLHHVARGGFEPKRFVDAIRNLTHKDEKKFLRACSILSDVCIKDCDVCDSPTFSGCVTCTHVNSIVCLGCISCYDCTCRNRAVLFRYPLEALERMVAIVQREYKQQTGKVWGCQTRPALVIPDAIEIFKVDANSAFSVARLPIRPKVKAPLNETGSAAATEVYRDIDSSCLLLLAWRNGANESSAKSPSKKKRRNSVTDIGQQIIIMPQQSLSKTLTANENGALVTRDSTVLVTKLTLKYIVLALEEDKTQGMAP